MKSNSKETNTILEPSKFAIKFVDAVFLMGIMFLIFVLVYGIFRIIKPYEYKPESTFYYLYIIGAVISIIILSACRKWLSKSSRVNLSLSLISVVISIYIIEIYITYLTTNHSHQTVWQDGGEDKGQILQRMGKVYDARTKMELLEDLRKSGVKAYPAVFPHMFIKTNGLVIENGNIFPLSGISNVKTILCNESGFWSIYESDKYGFNNNALVYNNNVDIILTGDSFAEGSCVKPDQTIAANLIKNKFNTISLGKANNGPLIEYAVLREYAEQFKPTVVLWLFFSNDLKNLSMELKSELLRKYLNDDYFSQKLILRQNNIDNKIVDYLEKIKNKYGKKKKREWKSEVFSLLILRSLRARLQLYPDPESKLFFEILSKANHMISHWKSRMYFVYLPGYLRYSKNYEYVRYEEIMETVTKMNIPIIDLNKEVFESHSNPLSLFSKYGGHYNSEGYRLVAEAISKRLKSDGIFPSSSRN